MDIEKAMKMAEDKNFNNKEEIRDFLRRKNFGDIEVDIFFEKYDFDYKRSLANALAADDITLEMKDEDLETENVGQDRPRSGKEGRQRRAERIASASGRDRKIESD